MTKKSKSTGDRTRPADGEEDSIGIELQALREGLFTTGRLSTKDINATARRLLDLLGEDETQGEAE